MYESERIEPAISRVCHKKKMLPRICIAIMTVVISPCLTLMLSNYYNSLPHNYLNSFINRENPTNGTLLLYSPSASGRVEIEEVPITTNVSNVTEQQLEITAETDSQLLLSQNISDATEDLSVYNNIDGEIIKTSIKPNPGTDFINLPNGGQVRNCTDLDNDVLVKEMQNNPDFNIVLDGTPQVLIMHTHTSESYELCDKAYYDEDYNCRCTDPTQNVVAVGTEIAKSLADGGIGVVHDGTVHDEAYKGAYQRSSDTVKGILGKYPTIRVVLDIHRDALEENDGTRLATIAEVDGKEAAQIMIISAADDGTYDMPNFLQNFRFAALIEQQLESDYSGITRPILFQYCQYNQELSTGSLLIEVGGHANTLEQAKYSGNLLGRSLAKVLKCLEKN